MAQLWEWDAVYPDGSSHGHQAEEPFACATEAQMLERLKTHFPHLTITKLRRCGPFEPRKDPIGPIHKMAYRHGIWEAAMRELGVLAPERKPTIRERLNRERVMSIAGIPRLPIRQRIQGILNH